MTNISEKFIRNLIPDNNTFFKSMEEYANINNIPIVEKEVGNLLKLLIKMHRPKCILEIGTAIGYSALTMAHASSDDIRITSIERRQDMVDMAKKNINNSKYRDSIEILHGEAEEVLENLDEMYDFIFLDAAKGHYLDFFNKSKELLNPHGLIISDNVLFRGMVADNKLLLRRKITIVKRLRQYLKHISNIEGYATSVLPLGDGVAITFKEGDDFE